MKFYEILTLIAIIVGPILAVQAEKFLQRNRDTKMRKVFNLQDHNLAPNLQYGIYIDDVDFQQIDLSNDANFAINMKAESGVWVETADHKYRAYVFIHSVNNTAKSAVISIKRYPL